MTARRRGSRFAVARVCVVAAVAAVTTLPADAVPPAPDPYIACSQGLPEESALVGVEPGRERELARLVRRLDGRLGVRLAPLSTYEVVFASADAANVAVGALRHLSWVRYAEVQSRMQALGAPVDPLLSQQWGLDKVGAHKAWRVEVGQSSPVDVAVIDTGSDFDHPDLKANLIPGGLNAMPGAGPPQDDHNHGTHVAGVIAASANNRIGIAGMSWGARILTVKALGADGSGTNCSVIAGILFAAAHGARIINMSLASLGPCGFALQEAIDFAHGRNVLSIAAVGNSGAEFNTTHNPANCDNVLGVAATTPDDRRAPFSNYGPYVDISAPGTEILSTVWSAGKGKLHGYAPMSGTSMASPLVAGLAALVASRHPDWTPDQIAQHLTRTSKDLGRKGWDPEFGVGRIDAAKAVLS